MFDDVAAQFHEAILSAYQDYVKVRDGDTSGRSQHMRAALDLATHLFHFREHLPEEHALSRMQVSAACPDYRLIADVANASKHGGLDRPTSEGPPLVKSAEDITELTVVTTYEDLDGKYPDAETRVMIRCSDGSNRNLDVALTNVMNFWGQELERLQVLRSYRPFPPPTEPGSQFVARSAARNMNLEMTQGVRFRQSVQLRKFDRTTGRSEPVDLSGSEVSFRIYKPPTVYLSGEVTLPGGSEPMRIDIPLSEEEAVQYAVLRTDTEKEDFMKRAVQNHSGEIRLGILEQMRSKSDDPKLPHSDNS